MSVWCSDDASSCQDSAGQWTEMVRSQKVGAGGMSAECTAELVCGTVHFS